MDKTTKLKEAFKTGLAFALVFGLAMQFGWMNPYWAGWAVAVIALPTTGESLRKDRHLWERFQSLGSAFSQTVARWQSGLAELERIELRAVLPELPALLAELEARLAPLAPVLAGQPSGHQPITVRLEFDSLALGRLSGFERAAVEVARKELEELEVLTAALLECALQLAGHPATASQPEPLLLSSRTGRTTLLPVPDWEHLRCAAYVTATTVVGFLIWILFDPPGHSGWFQAGGSFALVVALYPQQRPSRMIAPVAVTSAICLVIYVMGMSR